MPQNDLMITGPALVVETNSVMARIVSDMLSQIGIGEVETSTSLRETITRLEATKFGLIISEYATAPITGFDLWRVVTGREDWAGTPFILMADEERKRHNIGRFEDAGLQVVLTKPFSVEQLKNSIELVTSKNPFESFV